MDLNDKLTMMADLMRTTKNDWVATQPRDTDLEVYLHFWRGDELVAAVQCRPDQTSVTDAGHIGAMGFNADTMAVTFESFHSNLKESPLTGQPWRHREMQFVFETYPDASERGWVSECVSTSMHERDGLFAMHYQEYRIKDWVVEWMEAKAKTVAPDTDFGSSPAEQMFEFLEAALTRPKLDTAIAEVDNPIATLVDGLFPVGSELRLYHTDMATIHALEERGVSTNVVLRAEVGSDREKWLTERLGPPVLMPDQPKQERGSEEG